MVMVPEALTLAMVSLDWAKALLASDTVIARASKCFFMTGSDMVENSC
jgi:hypothetical protein